MRSSPAKISTISRTVGTVSMKRSKATSSLNPSKIFTLKKIFKPDNLKTSALLEVATKANFNLSCVPGHNPTICVAQLERVLEESARQTGLWTTNLDPLSMEVPGPGQSGPMVMEMTDADDA